MDHKIYYRTAADYGQYAVRRYPKGRGAPSAPPSGPTQAIDPNANPLTIQRHAGLPLVGPHTTPVERWTYTVPIRRRMQVQSVRASTTRIVVSATDLAVNSFVQIIRANSVVLSVFVAAQLTTGVVGAHVEQNHSGPLELFEGDTISGLTHDDNATGACNHAISLIGIEYDAMHRVLGVNASLSQFEGASNPGAGGGLRSFLIGQSGGGGYAAKFPTAYAAAHAQGMTEAQAQIAGNTGIIPGANVGAA